MATDLHSYPPPGPIRQRQPRRCNPPVLGGPCLDQTRLVDAYKPVLPPHQTPRATKHGQIDQLDQRPLLDPSTTTTPGTPWPRPAGLNMHPHRITRHIIDTEDVDVGKADEQLTDTDRVRLHRGSPI